MLSKKTDENNGYYCVQRTTNNKCIVASKIAEANMRNTVITIFCLRLVEFKNIFRVSACECDHLDHKEQQYLLYALTL